MTEPTPANLLTVLERDPEKCSGAWIFRGTRVPVHALFDNLKDGASMNSPIFKPVWPLLRDALTFPD